jgi:hypothetical protein
LGRSLGGAADLRRTEGAVSAAAVNEYGAL